MVRTPSVPRIREKRVMEQDHRGGGQELPAEVSGKGERGSHAFKERESDVGVLKPEKQNGDSCCHF